MIFEASEFVFKAPAAVARARRVLIKPYAAHPAAYPVTTSRNILSVIIRGIRRVSDADILILESAANGESIYPIYQALGYDFPRVLLLDVKDCIWVEVDNPLPKPLTMPTFWVPNVILSSDYLITVTPLKVLKESSHLSITNILTLLPASKYRDETSREWGALYSLGIDRVAADLYFTLPFDLGIIEARQKFINPDYPAQGTVKEHGKIFVGEPYQVDYEAAETVGLKTEYLNWIRKARASVES
ncbi:MAG: DUF362 domain-containing protein [Dehalococcoidales bacterium]|nr:DUF362 domain-containing protein [Dehalococcoidales bacterium]MDP7310318.1 DUF362 domain-containing protein [Dehalococcoidales bacterium]